MLRCANSTNEESPAHLQLAYDLQASFRTFCSAVPQSSSSAYPDMLQESWLFSSSLSAPDILQLQPRDQLQDHFSGKICRAAAGILPHPAGA